MNQDVYDATDAALFDVDEGKYLQGERAEYVPDSPDFTPESLHCGFRCRA